MSAKKNIVISDIHIGTNVTTNWYQKDIHEPYLAYILQWVVDNKTDVDELIILGDLFDFWTYPPNKKPPSAAEIINENPNILGPEGLLNDVLNALEGRVSYVHGNHDITTTQEDLNGIGNSQHKIKLQKDIYLKDNVVYTHGHLQTMFNAPDLGGQPIPVGHFVTRAVSYYLLQQNENAANEPGFGVPNMGYGGLLEILKEFSIPYIMTHLHEILNFSITAKFLDIIQDTTGIPDDYPIILERNLGTTTFAEVKNNYANLWSEWMQQYATGGDLSRGFMFAYKAAFSDYDGRYLGWSAQQLAFEYGANLVVMGHTHIPKSGLVGDIANYLNSGFECVPKPDMSKSNMTYSVVVTDNGNLVSSEVLKVLNKEGQYQSSDDSPPPANVIADNNDDSCYISIQNNSDENYLLVPNTTINIHGYYPTNPPNEIPSNSTVKFWIQDLPGPYGSDGKVTYRCQNSGNTVLLNFSCANVNVPLNRNSCGGTSEFYSKSGSIHNNWGAKNIVAEEGHPLFVKFIINQGSTNEVTIVDHLTGGTDIGGPQLIGNYPGTGIIELASGFDVTGNSFNLTKIVLDVEYPSNDNTILNVVLCSDLNGLPGSEIEIMSIIVPNHSSNSEVLSNNKPLLENGKRYWIKLSIKDKSLKATWDRAGNISGINAYKIDDKPFQSGGYTSPPVDVFAYRMAVIGCPTKSMT